MFGRHQADQLDQMKFNWNILGYFRSTAWCPCGTEARSPSARRCKMPDGPTMGLLSIPGVEGCTTSGTSPALTVAPRDNLNLANLNEEADGVRIISHVKKLSSHNSGWDVRFLRAVRSGARCEHLWKNDCNDGRCANRFIPASETGYCDVKGHCSSCCGDVPLLRMRFVEINCWCVLFVVYMFIAL
jgi:hypothetical protein